MTRIYYDQDQPTTKDAQASESLHWETVNKMFQVRGKIKPSFKSFEWSGLEVIPLPRTHLRIGFKAHLTTFSDHKPDIPSPLYIIRKCS